MYFRYQREKFQGNSLTIHSNGETLTPRHASRQDHKNQKNSHYVPATELDACPLELGPGRSQSRKTLCTQSCGPPHTPGRIELPKLRSINMIPKSSATLQGHFSQQEGWNPEEEHRGEEDQVVYQQKNIHRARNLVKIRSPPCKITPKIRSQIAKGQCKDLLIGEPTPCTDQLKRQKAQQRRDVKEHRRSRSSTATFHANGQRTTEQRGAQGSSPFECSTRDCKGACVCVFFFPRSFFSSLKWRWPFNNSQRCVGSLK